MNKIALIHRYGLEGWICCGGHSVPELISQLSETAEIHFYGPKTTEKIELSLREKFFMHELPYTWDRAKPSEKFTKTILWYFWLPIIGLKCRFNKTKLIWNDETVPLSALILQIFFGGKIALTVMDFFMRIYTQNHKWLHWLRDLVEKIDYSSWKRLDLILTKVLYTQEFLETKGISRDKMTLYRNPIDHKKFHPIDEKTRAETRKKLGFSDGDLVLSHHGILHPNKGNDWILHRIAELKTELPNLKFLLIGNGPEMESLKKLTGELGIKESVKFTSWLPTEEDLNNALAASDIGLVMRIGQETDHFHMTDTLSHEMACAKPILAVNLKGIAEIIKNGENGFLFSPENPAEFCEALKTFSKSAEVREKCANNALETSRSICSINAITDPICEKIIGAVNV